MIPIHLLVKLTEFIHKYGPLALQAIVATRDLIKSLNRKKPGTGDEIKPLNSDDHINSGEPVKLLNSGAPVKTLTKTYFSKNEFACKCGKACDAPPVKPELIYLLNQLREVWGKPMVVNSGSRCTYWNEQVGGVPSSRHLLGEAADIHTGSMQASITLAELAEKVGFGGIGIYPGFVHLDIGPKRSWTGKQS